MARLFVYDFAAPGSGNQARSLVKFYSDSGATTPVAVYGSELASAALPQVRADAQGQVTADLWVDSSVTTLYARTENTYTTPSSTLLVPTGNPTSSLPPAAFSVDGGSP